MTTSQQPTNGHQSSDPALTLVLGGTGKTGRRIVQRLEQQGVPLRIGSRSAEIPFEWNDSTTWAPALAGVAAVYIAFHPDLAVPGAADTIRAFSAEAVRSGVTHLVLLSGRGEEEAQRSERIIQEAGVDWTILRATWFSQNFSEGFLRDAVLSGVVALPVGGVREPFVDADDIADVAVAALTQPGHAGQLYELTGPRLLTFAEAVADIAAATGREIAFASIPHEAFVSGLTQLGVPSDYIHLLDFLFREVMDGRNERLSDGIQRALGRQPRDFSAYARRAAAVGAWEPMEVSHA